MSLNFLFFSYIEYQSFSHDYTQNAGAAAKSLQLCMTLWDPIDSSPPGSAVPRILQVRTIEWVGISFFNAWKWKVKVKSFSHVWLLATPWTAAYQASLSFTISWNLLKLRSIESEIPATHFIFYCPLLLLPSIFPGIRVFQWVSSLHQVAKVLELLLQHQSFQWIFRIFFFL